MSRVPAATRIPIASIATTYESREEVDPQALVEVVSAAARTVSRRVGGH